MKSLEKVSLFSKLAQLARGGHVEPVLERRVVGKRSTFLQANSMPRPTDVVGNRSMAVITKRLLIPGQDLAHASLVFLFGRKEVQK